MYIHVYISKYICTVYISISYTNRNALSDPRTYSRGPYSSQSNYQPPPPHYSMSYDSPDHMYSSPQYGRRPSQYPPPHRPSGNMWLYVHMEYIYWRV